MGEVRLIDANALKYKNLAEVNGRLTYVLTAEEINNAPTVDPNKDYGAMQYSIGYNDGFMSAKELITKEPERPQGEWVEVGDNQPYSKDKLYGCSKCRFGSYLLSDTKNVNFCQNCGTRMKGSVEE